MAKVLAIMTVAVPTIGTNPPRAKFSTYTPEDPSQSGAVDYSKPPLVDFMISVNKILESHSTAYVEWLQSPVIGQAGNAVIMMTAIIMD